MKLGKDTGSLTNYMIGTERDLKPEIGMGVTELCWSDRYPYTIIDISKSGKTITIQQDKAIRIDDNGMSENQEYRYERDLNGLVYKARKNKYGKWKIIGGGSQLLIGEREKYYDFSF